MGTQGSTQHTLADTLAVFAGTDTPPTTAPWRRRKRGRAAVWLRPVEGSTVTEQRRIARCTLPDLLFTDGPTPRTADSRHYDDQTFYSRIYFSTDEPRHGSSDAGLN